MATRVTQGHADDGRVPPVDRGARFVDPKVLAAIGNLDLVARITVDGFISGLHRTRHLGVSTEFAEHRGYTPGDDVRHVDWKVFARTDRFYVKTYEAETNADLVLALDVSGSMGFGGADALDKFDYARIAAASLARLAARQGDRVGLATFNDTLVDWIPPSGRHRERLMTALENARTGGGSDLAAALDRLGATLVRRGIVVVLSDFYAPVGDIVTALDTLRVRGHDVIAIHVLHPMEKELPPASGEGGFDVLEDLESGERVPVDPARQGAEFRDLVAGHVAELDAGSGARGIQYGQFTTDQPLDFVLNRFLAVRQRLARVR